MPTSDFINVRLLIDGVEATEYVNLQGSHDTKHFKARYVEGKAGQTLGLCMTLEPGFNFRGASVIASKFHIDDRGSCWMGSVKKDQCFMWHDIIDQEITDYFKTRAVRNPVTQCWEQVPFVIMPLAKVQDAQLPNFRPEALDSLGKVTLTVYRAFQKTLRKPRPQSHSRALTDKVPETLMKGREPKSIIGFGESGRACNPPPLLLHEDIPIRGQNGRPYIFEFYYRERSTLKAIGCDVRSLTPEAEMNDDRGSSVNASIQNSDETFEMLKRQNMRLQKQVDTMNWQSKMGDSRKRIKIEDSDDDENENEDKKLMPAPKRQKLDQNLTAQPSNQRPVIDLTGDSD